MQPSKACNDFVAGFEALRLFAYPDPASPLALATSPLRGRWGFEPARDLLASQPASVRKLSGAPWTVGYGHTEDVTPDSVVTAHQAVVLLEHGIAAAWWELEPHIHVPLTQGMVDALTSIYFNVGPGEKGRKDGLLALKKTGLPSTLIRKLNAGDYAGARDQFQFWDNAGGREMAGLKRRRLAEADMFGDAPPDFSNVIAGSATTAPGSSA